RSDSVMARLILKGNFIWSATDPTVYLDGEAFAISKDRSLPGNLRLPSGDGRRGGDFEMWVLLGRGSGGNLIIFRRKTSAISKYVVDKLPVLKHDFPGSVSKSAFLQKYGTVPLADGSTVSDALSVLVGNPSFSSVEAISDAVANAEASSLQ